MREGGEREGETERRNRDRRENRETAHQLPVARPYDRKRSLRFKQRKRNAFFFFFFFLGGGGGSIVYFDLPY